MSGFAAYPERTLEGEYGFVETDPLAAANARLGYAALALLIFGTLALGAVAVWSTTILEIGAALLLIAWVVLWALRHDEQPISLHPLFLPAVLYVLVIAVQWAMGLTAYRFATGQEAMLYAAYGALLLIATQCLAGDSVRRTATLAITCFGTIYALYATLQDVLSPGEIYGVIAKGPTVYGTYVNHNHYAGLIEMLIPFPIVLGLSRILPRDKKAFALVGAVLMASTLFLAGSRAGILSLVVQLLAVPVVLRRRRRRALNLEYAALLVAMLGVVAFLYSGRLSGRVRELAPDMRASILKDSAAMVRQRPLLGFGLGTFPTVYPAYRSFYSNLFVNEAHNDYLQVLVETGVAGFALMIWFLVVLLRCGRHNSEGWDVKWGAACSAAALLGCIGLLVHSLVDFNLHIPANAAWFYFLCGLAATRPGNPQFGGAVRF